MAASPIQFEPPSGEAGSGSVTPRRKRRVLKTLLVTGLLFLIIGGTGAGGWWWYSQRATTAPADGHAVQTVAASLHGQQGILPLPPFTVNLADQDAARYLRVDLRLVVDDGSTVKALEEDAITLARLRSAIIEILSQKTTDALTTAEGKQALKTEIASTATGILRSPKVSDVLFTEFVVQF